MKQQQTQEQTMDKTIDQTELAKLRRSLRSTRIFCILSSLLTACLLAGGIFCFAAIRQAAVKVKPILQQITALDMEELNGTVDQLNATLESVDWKQLSQTIGQLDMDSINTAIQNLDTAELSKALENLNSAIDTLEKISQAFQKLTQF